MFTSIFIFITVLTSIVDADCKTFKYSPQIVHKWYNPSHPEKFTQFDIPLYTQTQQITPGITCNDPQVFRQHHKEQEQSNQAATNLCYSHQCAYPAQGYTYARAMTNITARSHEDQEAIHRITMLAHKQVPWHLQLPSKDNGLVYRVALHGKMPEYAACLDKGESGWAQFRPEFSCSVGTLKDCTTNGSKLEQDGQIVAVCMPYAFGRDPTDILGSTYTNKTSNAEVQLHRKNPALSEPVPNKSGIPIKDAPSKSLPLVTLGLISFSSYILL